MNWSALKSCRFQSPFVFFFLVSIGRNASGRVTPTIEHDYVLTCIPAIAHSHARYPLRDTVARDIVNREYVLSRLIALRPSAVCAACSGDANTSGSREKIYRAFLLVRCSADGSSKGDTRRRMLHLNFNSERKATEIEESAIEYSWSKLVYSSMMT